MGKGKRKDSLSLKRPANAFFEFSKDERERDKATLGSMTFGEVQKEVGRRWRNLPAEEKIKYEDRARENSEKYEATRKDLRARSAPQKPPGPFLEFSRVEKQKLRAESPSLTGPEVQKELGRRWQTLPETHKNVFKEKSKKNMEEYSQKMKDFYENMSLSVMPSTSASASETVSITSSVTSNSALQPPIEPIEVEAEDEEILDKAEDSLTISDSSITVSDLGFAKQRFYPWHPALKTGVLARGSRISVTYFGTAQTGTVDKAKWVPYSELSEARICSSSLLQRSSFRKGLEKLKTMLGNIISGEVSVSMSSGVGFTEQPVGRKLVKLSKEGLQKDEEQNLKFMRDKIVEMKEGPYKWSCRDCSWKGKYSNKAKAHARDCGTRRRENKKKPKSNKFECSGDGCNLTFAYRNQLQKHYRCGLLLFSSL